MVFLQPEFRHSTYRMHSELFSELKIEGDLTKDLFHLQKQLNNIWLRSWFYLYCLWIKYTFVIYIAKLDSLSSILAEKNHFCVKENHLLWLDISVYKLNLASDTTNNLHWRRQNRSAWTAVNSHAFFFIAMAVLNAVVQSRVYARILGGDLGYS